VPLARGHICWAAIPPVNWRAIFSDPCGIDLLLGPGLVLKIAITHPGVLLFPLTIPRTAPGVPHESSILKSTDDDYPFHQSPDRC